MPLNRLPVWDLSTRFTSLQIGSALNSVWSLDGPSFKPIVDIDGYRVPCPITLQPLEEPVLLGDGSVYERNAITQWLEENTDGRAPLTNLKLPHTAMLRLEPLRAVVEAVVSRSSHTLGFQLRALMKEAAEVLETVGSEMEMLRTQEDLDGCIGRCKSEIRQMQDVVLLAEQWRERLNLQIEKEASKKYVAQRVRITGHCQHNDLLVRSAKQIKASMQVYFARSQLVELNRQHQTHSRAMITVQRFARRFLANAHIMAEQRHMQRVQQLGQQLQVACQNGNTQLVKLFLERRADPNGFEEKHSSTNLFSGWQPALTASQMGHSEILRVLFHARANLDVRSVHGTTPLHAAAHVGVPGVVTTLLELGADIDQPGLDGETALFRASQAGHSEIVRILCQAGTCANSITTSGATSLHTATQRGHLGVIHILCSHGVELDRVENEGATSLYIASQQGLIDAVETICEARADVNKARLDGSFPLFVASQYGHDDVVRVLCQKGGNVNQTRYEGSSALHTGAQQGHDGVVRTLCSNRADLNLMNKYGATPLYIASQNGFLPVVRALCEAGADRDKAHRDGATPLFIACFHSQLGAQLVRTLCDAGADKNQAQDGGATPLYIASQNGLAEVVQILCDRGADLNKAKSGGTAPLHIAAQQGHSEVVRILCQAGAHRGKRKEDGSTPLDIASRMNFGEVERVLKEPPLRADSANSFSSAQDSPEARLRQAQEELKEAQAQITLLRSEKAELAEAQAQITKLRSEKAELARELGENSQTKPERRSPEKLRAGKLRAQSPVDTQITENGASGQSKFRLRSPDRPRARSPEPPRLVQPLSSSATRKPQMMEKRASGTEVFEKIVEVPIPQIQTVEKIVEVPQMQHREKIIEVPCIQYKEKIEYVPQVVYEEVVKHVPRVMVQEVIKQVPKTIFQEVLKQLPPEQYAEYVASMGRHSADPGTPTSGLDATSSSMAKPPPQVRSAPKNVKESAAASTWPKSSPPRAQ